MKSNDSHWIPNPGNQWMEFNCGQIIGASQYVFGQIEGEMRSLVQGSGGRIIGRSLGRSSLFKGG